VLESRAGATSPQTAIMDESTINPLESAQAMPGPSDELDQTGEVGSELGDSYIDGKPSRVKTQSGFASQHDDEDPLLADGGVLRLLAQIYGSALPARVI